MFSFSCGYRIAGKASAIPSSINSIAVPIFVNQTTKYRLEQRLTGAVVEELISRTNYQITSDARSSDALLSGIVTEFNATPVIFINGVGSTFLITVRLKLELKELRTNKVLFQNSNYFFREEFQISQESEDFFPDEGPALERLSRSFSRDLVSTILESF